ncbi:AraC-like DNA-binding protein [Chryseobacterium defluvii]|uniref:AraC-like DNA-binding protein n=1 Tax=Chryseobacterium defluvii TaxID=160396 RepID=A0A840KCL5_9FLAO|nr:helix-turn-helix transcriptional regulator [Chryseobacterium defluvii]MBB4805273.1 AraC-like DNA-binding protein [Chryseobacterium defluvii]
MKKIILLLLCIVSNFVFSQEDLLTQQVIDKKIDEARKFSVNDPKKSLEILKETYFQSKQLSYRKGMLESNKARMAQYYDTGNFREVLNLSKETEQLADENKDIEALSNVYRLRGSAYTELGFNDESLKDFKKAFEISKDIPFEDSKHYNQSLIFTGFGVYMAHTNAPIDSVIHYQKKSLGSALKISDNPHYLNKKYHVLALDYMNLGMTSVAKNNPAAAEKYFTQSLNICRDDRYLVNVRTHILVLNEFAWLYYDQKEYDKVIDYAKQAEQLEKQISFPYIRRDIFEVLFKSYVEKGEKEKSSAYMRLFSTLNDSIINAEKRTINTPVKQILSEKDTLHTSNIRNILVAVCLIAIALFAIGWFFWKKNQRKLHAKYEAIIENLKKAEKTIAPDPLSATDTFSAEKNATINITDDTANLIISKLDKFEKSQKFTRKELSLTSLANELNTNTRYLSEIIKQHKGKNYNNYINSLRINYIIAKLYENPVYREYKISYLAEDCGFSSREVFAVIFKKETGVTPSYFINNLKKDYTE